MKLYYKIEFNSTNLYYKHIIENLVKQNGINAYVRQYKAFILLICDDSEEKITSFFEFLGENLPLSIFVGKSYTLDFFDESQEQLEDKNILQNISIFTNKEIANILKENASIDFSNDINILKKGKVSKIETHNGLKDLFLPSRELREKFENEGNEVKLFVCNINKLSNLVELSPKDLQLLCSIERPLVKLKFKILKNQNKEFSKTDFIYVKIPDDKESILFANALQKEGIDYLLYVKEESLQDGLKVTYFKDDNIIVKGEKSLFPKYDYNLDKKYNSSKEYFEENGGVAKGILAALNKRIKPTIGVYFSQKRDNSAIFVNIPGKGLKEIISIPNIICDVNNAMEEISSIDENCLRLVQNYNKKFPSYFEKELKNIEADGFEAIMNLCAYVLGMEDYLEFENAAFAYNSKSGLQIDMRLIKIDGVNYLDYRKVVQSIMSYKMADVDNRMLAFSFYESLSDLIKDNVTKIAQDIDCKDLILCGDMFANSILLSKVSDSLGKSFEINISKEIPLDY